MTLKRRAVLAGLVAAIGLSAQSWAGARAETLAGSNVDTRFMLAFTANGEAIAPMMPQGWTAIGFPKGPLAGANLLIALEDRQIGMAADGSPAAAPKSRAAAVMALGKGEAGVRLFLLRVYTTDAGYDMLPDGVTAEVSRTSLMEGKPDGTHQSEIWSVSPTTGGEMSVSFDYDVGMGKWVSDEARLFSGSAPDMSRVFRYDQLVELVMSQPVGKPISGEFSITTSIPDLSGILDGSQELVGVLSYPVYVREVFEP